MEFLKMFQRFFMIVEVIAGIKLINDLIEYHCFFTFKNRYEYTEIH